MKDRNGRPEGYCRPKMINTVRYLADYGTQWPSIHSLGGRNPGRPADDDPRYR
ncbi:hypothetical protein [Streptomyces sp. NPDC058307]|uniref:hypothetical protein n=1 Tax=Streptomyces sp. NPDC058307 TaxID=3346439 RepID=UPI0036E0CED0